ncbi:MAG: hypothetical protein ACT6Q9_03415 [Polaromonas sp.]|uniref:hypothetical protein n=1 Tax=Polaromonas sp. TaxID=1869339 RepID=UPI0040371735
MKYALILVAALAHSTPFAATKTLNCVLKNGMDWVVQFDDADRNSSILLDTTEYFKDGDTTGRGVIPATGGRIVRKIYTFNENLISFGQETIRSNGVTLMFQRYTINRNTGSFIRQTELEQHIGECEQAAAKKKF